MLGELSGLRRFQYLVSLLVLPRLCWISSILSRLICVNSAKCEGGGSVFANIRDTRTASLIVSGLGRLVSVLAGAGCQLSLALVTNEAPGLAAINTRQWAYHACADHLAPPSWLGLLAQCPGLSLVICRHPGPAPLMRDQRARERRAIDARVSHFLPGLTI